METIDQLLPALRELTAEIRALRGELMRQRPASYLDLVEDFTPLEQALERTMQEAPWAYGGPGRGFAPLRGATAPTLPAATEKLADDGPAIDLTSLEMERRRRRQAASVRWEKPK